MIIKVKLLSTHHKPLDSWLKEVLRLNRDPKFFYALKTVYQDLARGLLVTAARGMLLSGRCLHGCCISSAARVA